MGCRSDCATGNVPYGDSVADLPGQDTSEYVDDRRARAPARMGSLGHCSIVIAGECSQAQPRGLMTLASVTYWAASPLPSPPPPGVLRPASPPRRRDGAPGYTRGAARRRSPIRFLLGCASPPPSAFLARDCAADERRRQRRTRSPDRPAVAARRESRLRELVIFWRTCCDRRWRCCRSQRSRPERRQACSVPTCCSAPQPAAASVVRGWAGDDRCRRRCGHLVRTRGRATPRRRSRRPQFVARLLPLRASRELSPLIAVRA